MFLMTPCTEITERRKMVNLEGITEIKVDTVIFETIIQGKQAEQKMFGALKAKLKDGTEETLATYEDMDAAEMDLEDMAEAMEDGAMLYKMHEDTATAEFLDPEHWTPKAAVTIAED